MGVIVTNSSTGNGGGGGGGGGGAGGTSTVPNTTTSLAAVASSRSSPCVIRSARVVATSPTSTDPGISTTAIWSRSIIGKSLLWVRIQTSENCGATPLGSAGADGSKLPCAPDRLITWTGSVSAT